MLSGAGAMQVSCNKLYPDGYIIDFAVVGMMPTPDNNPHHTRSLEYVLCGAYCQMLPTTKHLRIILSPVLYGAYCWVLSGVTGEAFDEVLVIEINPGLSSTSGCLFDWVSTLAPATTLCTRQSPPHTTRTCTRMIVGG